MIHESGIGIWTFDNEQIFEGGSHQNVHEGDAIFLYCVRLRSESASTVAASRSRAGTNADLWPAPFRRDRTPPSVRRYLNVRKNGRK